MTVGRICVREVDLAQAGESLQAAAARMRDRRVGTLVVLDEVKRPIGIITDRDMTVRVVADGRDSREMKVADAMTPLPESIREDAPIEEALRMMRSGPFRRLPVVAPDGSLAGLLSLDDILELLAEEFGAIGKLIGAEEPKRRSEEFAERR